MPLPVVPILPVPLLSRSASRAASTATWNGRISGHDSLISRRERTSRPIFSRRAISISRCCGSTTTPLPIRQATPSRMTPDGISCSAVFTPLITSVWPALWPPWKRTTACAWSVSQSTTLPLPSSPHWVPTTTTLWPRVMERSELM